jgi:thiamine-monophosphate kinase
MLSAGVDRSALDVAGAACVEAYERPQPRLRMGRIIGRARVASACIDLSDGLADAARRFAEGAGCGVVLDADSLPIHPGARAWAARRGVDAVALALGGGEDYELAFAVSPRRRSGFIGATRRCRDLAVERVGRLVKEPGAWVERAGRRTPLPAGFTHF